MHLRDQLPSLGLTHRPGTSQPGLTYIRESELTLKPGLLSHAGCVSSAEQQHVTSSCHPGHHGSRTFSESHRVPAAAASPWRPSEVLAFSGHRLCPGAGTPAYPSPSRPHLGSSEVCAAWAGSCSASASALRSQLQLVLLAWSLLCLPQGAVQTAEA